MPYRIINKIYALTLLLLIFGISYSENRAPVVHAGDDMPDVLITGTVILDGIAEDDLTPIDSLIFQWSQIEGPAQADIITPALALTAVSFSQTGQYRFRLAAYDGNLTGADTIHITVRSPKQFSITSPSASARIVPGTTITITWQMEPSIPCNVYCSLNSGLSYVLLNTNGAVKDSFEWEIDRSYLDSARIGIIRVEEYQNSMNFTNIDFSFNSDVSVKRIMQSAHSWSQSLNSESYTPINLSGRLVAYSKWKLIAPGMILNIPDNKAVHKLNKSNLHLQSK